MSKLTLSRLAKGYFAIQGLSVAMWWIVLLSVPGSREVFFQADFLESDFWLFLIADLVFVAGGSALVAVTWSSAKPWFQPVIWMVVGAVNYATICTMNLLYLQQATWIAVILMLFASAGTTFLAVSKFGALESSAANGDS